MTYSSLPFFFFFKLLIQFNTICIRLFEVKITSYFVLDWLTLQDIDTDFLHNWGEVEGGTKKCIDFSLAGSPR